MKLIFISYYSGQVNRGGEIFVHHLANSLASTNEVIVMQTGPRRRETKYSTIRLSSFKRKWQPLSVRHVLRRLFITPQNLAEFAFYLRAFPRLFDESPDIVIPMNAGWGVALVKIYCFLKKKRLVITGQSGPGWDDRFNLLWSPNMFVALTEYQKNWAKTAVPFTVNVTKIPNGVDLNEFCPHGDRLKLSIEEPRVLIVGAAIPSKRVAATIRAVSLLKRATLVWVGSGPLEVELINLGKKLLGHRFQHLSLKPEKMPTVYRSCQAFTLCSDSSEAFGIVYLEALATGLHIVASDDEPRREILGRTGILIKSPTDAAQYAKALKQALKQSRSRAAVVQARKFAWETVARQYQLLFKSFNI